MIQISIEEIQQKFVNLISGSESRESVSDWARQAREAADAEQLEYVPSNEKSRIWDAILYLEGVDLKESPTEYLHCEADFQTYLLERVQPDKSGQ